MEQYQHLILTQSYHNSLFVYSSEDSNIPSLHITKISPSCKSLSYTTKSISVNIPVGNDNDFKDSDVYKDQEMTCTDYTYNGYPIYSYTFTPTWGGGQFRFKHYKNGDWKEDYTSDWHSITEQIYRGYYNE